MRIARVMSSDALQTTQKRLMLKVVALALALKTNCIEESSSGESRNAGC